jgi:hypothetical protein
MQWTAQDDASWRLDDSGAVGVGSEKGIMAIGRNLGPARSLDNGVFTPVPHFSGPTQR